MILLVTGDSAVLHSVRGIADELDMSLIDAPTGMCALAELLGARFKMIIVSGDLFDMSPEAFTRYVRRLDRHVPIIHARPRRSAPLALAA